MERGRVRGVLIAESLRPNSSHRGVPLEVWAITKFDAPSEPVGNAPTWTFLEFTADETRAMDLAESLAQCLDSALPWYASFKSRDRMFVVFSGRVFDYELGDVEQRARVESYARSIGVPESQLDWES